MDPFRDLAALAIVCGGCVGTMSDLPSCDIVILAVPVQRLEELLVQIAPGLRQGALVLDVCSVKVKPCEIMTRRLPSSVSIVGTHPLFGPQSGKDGIAGLNMAVCAVRGKGAALVRRFCRHTLGLRVFACSAAEHDRQMAYTQGLTHLIAKMVGSMNLPEFDLTTKTYQLMQQMVGMIANDSDELFRAIERENPFMAEAKGSFFAAARALEARLEQKSTS
jgi:prephenate dehydrogenase